MQIYHNIETGRIDRQGDYLRLFRSSETSEIGLKNHRGRELYMPSDKLASPQDISLSLVPFSISEQWFAIGIDYFEEVVEAKKIHNYGFHDLSFIKGLVVHNGLYVPVIDLPNIISFGRISHEGKIMILMSDSARTVAIGADSISKPERLSIGYNIVQDNLFADNGFIMKTIRLGHKPVHILNIEEILSTVEEELN